MLDGLHEEIAPLIKHTSGLVQSVDHIATTIREDVDRLSATVQRHRRTSARSDTRSR